MFHTIFILMTEGRWRKSATVITERLPNTILGNINTSPNLESIFIIKSLIPQKVQLQLKMLPAISYFLKQF